MALGEARSGSGQTLWSTLGQGLAAGASAIPGALAKERENKLKTLGAIFDAQNQIMAKQRHDQTMALNLANLKHVNLLNEQAVKALTQTPEQKLQDKMNVLGKLTAQYPNAAVSVEGLGVNPEPTPGSKQPQQQSWQNRMMDTMGVEGFADWYHQNKKESAGADPQLIARHQEYLKQKADQDFLAKFSDPNYVAPPSLTYSEWLKQYGGEPAPTPADLEPAVEPEDEDARLQELLDLMNE